MSSAHHTDPPKRSSHGLGYALLGGLGITLIAVLLGGAYLTWFLSAQRAPSPAALLPPDTQLYLGLAPTISNMPEVEQLDSLLRDQIGLDDPLQVRDAAIELLGVEYYTHVATWIGGSMAVAVCGLDVQGEASADRLLREGQIVFIIGSRNDPQAQAFLEKHLAARAARGDQIASRQVAGTTIYIQEQGALSPIRAFTLFEHYIIFANRPDVIQAMIERVNTGNANLAQVPTFAEFSAGQSAIAPGGHYSAGDDAAQIALPSLRELLANLAAL
ncbi:MAG: DUF3352 domain-containing protein [Oscillochloris sp.]|nr:DUF3352 domain-containing protein [Oscillochloris sp.]